MVEVEVAQGEAGGGVDGDVVVVADGGDGGAGPVAAEADGVAAAEVDGAVGGDGEGVDGGVVLAGQVAGAAAAGGGVPGVAGAGADGGVVAGVVPAAVVIEQELQVAGGGGGGAQGEPFFEGLVVALDLAAGLRVVGAGVDQPGAQCGDGPGELAGCGAGRAGAAGERGAVEFLSGVKWRDWS
ncbi:MAG TPA: hypothetical protein VGI00_17885 [Streptosporangiaceae bacterium]